MSLEGMGVPCSGVSDHRHSLGEAIPGAHHKDHHQGDPSEGEEAEHQLLAAVQARMLHLMKLRELKARFRQPSMARCFRTPIPIRVAAR